MNFEMSHTDPTKKVVFIYNRAFVFQKKTLNFSTLAEARLAHRTENNKNPGSCSKEYRIRQGVRSHF
jgi:hypothetical protein